MAVTATAVAQINPVFDSTIPANVLVVSGTESLGTQQAKLKRIGHQVARERDPGVEVACTHQRLAKDLPSIRERPQALARCVTRTPAERTI
jgi:hypothetical protein